MKKRVFKIIYIAIAVSAAISLVGSTVNYLQFYPALQAVGAKIQAQQVTRDSQNQPVQVLLQFAVVNPTGYSGLRLEYVVIHLYFTASNDTIFKEIPLLGSNATNTSLGPRSSISLKAGFSLVGNQSSVLASFLATHGASIVSHYNVEVHLFTFLDPLAPTLEVVRDVQYPSS